MMTTNDERRTTNDTPTQQTLYALKRSAGSRQISLGRQMLVIGGRWPVLVVLVLLLAACSTTAGQSSDQPPPSGGSISPEAVAQSFFDDLDKALDDPKLADDQQRGAWVERLAGYFAPNERDDQRIALRTALDSFSTGLGKLEPNEDLKLDLKIERLEQVSETGDRALIRPINGAIYVLITRTTNAGVQNLYEETVPLEKILGNDGSVPVLRIGRTWYLTEG